MAQRGGAVSSHVRFGPKVFSPLIPLGQADVLLAFEQAEAQRWVHFLKPEGTAIVNNFRWVPPIALMKGFSYPSDPLAAVRRRVKHVRIVDANSMAVRLGNPRVANAILVGAVSACLDLPETAWDRAIRKHVPPGTEDLNGKAFREGRR
jgi:indolepyruvate ferredoxin oxidoreductase beta subunit